MKATARLLLILALATVGLTGVHPAAASHATVATGDLVAMEEGSFQFDGHVDPQTGMRFYWSTQNAVGGRIWVYGNYGAVAFASGYTDVCQIRDASTFTYSGSPITVYDSWTGFILIRRNAPDGTTYYGAVDLIDVYLSPTKPAAYGLAALDTTWYFQADGTADFGPCNEAPVADANGPYLAAVNESFIVDGSGSFDPDGDVLSYVWSLDGSDRTGVSATLTAPAVAGVYPVELTVDDGHDETDSASSYVVVYDPSAGFVTGGGWFVSPEGAYAPDPALTGHATFGFVSRYQKHSTTPTGNTEFQFQAAGLNFRTTEYDWLLVTGDDTARFKGSGSVNEVDGYRFMIWAGDDIIDTFRIRIWTETDGIEDVLYDNGSDQPIDGGSIVVHTKKK